MQRFPWLRNPWYWLAFGLLAVAIRGLFLDVMDVDASQYASMAMEMMQDGSWLEVKHRHGDYLDKPPLLFWSSAASFMLFGLSNWAYKLPSFLAALAGVYAVYRFARLYYSHDTARNAAFILASSLGFILILNDVRTDTLLLAFTACTVWQLAAYHQGGRWRHLLGAGVFGGLALLAKGPIGLVMPVFALGTHLLLRRDWRAIFRWQWLAPLAVAGILLLPMCWGLYQQFDMQPQKVVNGRTGVSGLRFYFWEQSFGRITGESEWKNDSSPFYFLHIYLWAFLPWSLLLIGALGRRLRELYAQKLRLPAGDEAYSIGGFVLTFIALSLSRYKLPHYIFITLPWAAVLTARFLALAPRRIWLWGLYLSAAILMLLGVFMLTFVFPGFHPVLWAILSAILGYWIYAIIRSPFPANTNQWVQRGVLAMVAAALVLNFHFYPNLLPYQSTGKAMHYAKQRGIPADKLAHFRRHGHALDFYAGRILPQMDSPEQVLATRAAQGALWLYTTAAGKEELANAGVPFREELRLDHFQVALMKPDFLNPDTRHKVLQPVFLLEILANR